MPKQEIDMRTQKVQRAFIDAKGGFAFIRMREGKKWFRLTISCGGDIQLEDFEPKANTDFYFVTGLCRFHIHNKSLYCANRPVRALRISGPDLDIDTVVALMEFRKRTSSRCQNLR